MLNAFLYQKGKPLESNLTRARMFEVLHQKDILLWLDLENPNEFEAETLVELFNFHPLAVEDCISDLTSPKVDDYDEYLFLVTHAIRIAEDEKLITIELDIFLGENYVVTFHQEPVRGITQVRDHIQKKQESIMFKGADLLVHSILDHLVDNYLPVFDFYDQKIDKLEDEMFNNSYKNYLAVLLQVKRDLNNLRRILAPQREALHYLTRNPSRFIKAKHMVYFRDVYDHIFRVVALTESYHDTLSSVMQAYFSYQSNKLNEIMKRMTVLATLTMPTVMIASIYGMNFQHMPELNHPLGYLGSLALMASISIAMLIWMKLKKWI